MDISKLRTIDEYSKMIGKSYESVRKRVAGNRLKTRRIAGKDLIYLPDVQKDLERIKRKKAKIMVTRLELIESLFSIYKDCYFYQRLKSNCLSMSEKEFMDDYERITGHKLNRIVKNRYFINR